MRIVAGLLIAGVVSLGAAGAMWMRSPASPPADKLQQSAAASAPAKELAPKRDLKANSMEDVTASIPEPKPAPAPVKSTCANPNALGITRAVEIDTTGGPGFGFEH